MTLISPVGTVSHEAVIPPPASFSLDSPTRALALMTLTPSSLSRAAETTLSREFESFEPTSDDLMHLNSILTLLKKEGFSLRTKQDIASLSRYFEALTVYDGAVARSHLIVKKEDQYSLTVWNMVGYFSYAMRRFSSICPDVIEQTLVKLATAFKEDIPLLEMIYEYECLLEQKAKLEMKRYLGFIDDFQKNYLRKSLPEEKKLQRLLSSQTLSDKEKCAQIQKIWEKLCKDYQKENRVGFIMPCESTALSERVKALKNKARELETKIKKATETSSLLKVRRIIQALFEYEQIEAAIEATKAIIANTKTSREAMMQWLSILRESFKVVVPDKALKIDPTQSLTLISSWIIQIRDYFEHPEQKELQLDRRSSHSEKEQREQLEQKLLCELKEQAWQIAQLLQVRRDNLLYTLKPREGNTTEAILDTLSQREEGGDLSVDSEGFMKTVFPATIDFVNRIKKKVAISSSSLHENSKKSFQQVAGTLKTAIGGLSRKELERRLAEDIPFRLFILHCINRCAYFFDQYQELLSSEHVRHHYRLLEGICNEMRDQRNFNTHNFWRRDIKGIINTVYLICREAVPLIYQLEKPETFIEEGSFEHNIIQAIVQGKLTPEELEGYIRAGYLNVNVQDYKRRTLLHFIAENPSLLNLRLAEVLMRYGASIHLADYSLMRPLHIAAESGFLELAERLIEQGAVVDTSSNVGTPAEIAAKRGYLELAGLFFSESGRKRFSNARALIDAVEHLDISRVRGLIDEGIDVNADYQGDLALVALFNSEDADPDLQLEIAELLLDEGANIDAKDASGRCVLHMAVETTDNPDIIGFLMGLNPKLDLQDEKGDTSLHLAALCKHPNWMEALVQRGAALEVRNRYNETPLFNLCDCVCPPSSLIHRLLNAGADVQASNFFGTVLHHLVDRGDARSVVLALQAGASPFVLGRNGLYRNKFAFEVLPSDDWRTEKVDLVIERMRKLFPYLPSSKRRRLTTDPRISLVARRLFRRWQSRLPLKYKNPAFEKAGL